jgi:hypothetical protein
VIDLLTLAVGGGIFGGGVVFGAAVRSLPPRRRAPALPGLICSCTHSFGAHDEEKGCRADIQRDLPYPQDFEWVRCPCRKYDGPEPFSGLVPRGIVLPREER